MMRLKATRIKRYFPDELKNGSGNVLHHRDKSNKTMNIRLIWNRRDGVGHSPGARLAAFQRQGHLTRINDILSNLMEAERRIGSGR
jgi:hypothetical protein